jgi:hypothetical protein
MLGKARKETTMSKKLSIELSDIRNIIESDWDDNAIRMRIGEIVLQKAIEQDKGIESLLDIKFVIEPKREEHKRESKEFISVPPFPIASRCCRGRV